MGFYVNVAEDSNNNEVFYVNLDKAVTSGLNSVVENMIGKSNTKGIVDFASKYRVNLGLENAAMFLFNRDTGELVAGELHLKMQGISAAVSREIAEEVLKRAKYYCPVDTGRLRDSGRIDESLDGKCHIIFDCPYAWYVEQFEWRHHEYPTRAHFLSRAVEEIKEEYGIK